MNKIKVFWIYGSPSEFQEEIDVWSKEESPNIISTSISISKDYSAISIVYSDTLTEINLLKS